MGKDLGSLPPRVAAEMAEREEKRIRGLYPECSETIRKRGAVTLEECIMLAGKGVRALLRNGRVTGFMIAGKGI